MLHPIYEGPFPDAGPRATHAGRERVPWFTTFPDIRKYCKRLLIFARFCSSVSRSGLRLQGLIDISAVDRTMLTH